MNKEKVVLFLALLAFLVCGILIGRGFGIQQCNKHYQSEETQEDIYENYVMRQNKLNKIDDSGYVFDFNPDG